MLGDLSGEEVGALKEMTRRVLSLGVVGETDQVRLTHEHPHREMTLECKWLIVGQDGKPTWRDAEDIGPVPHALRLFHLLKVNDLGTESGAGSFGPRSGPGIVQVPVATFARLWPLIG